MSNIIDYVKWRGDLDFSQSEFNEVDSLILNRFSYFPLDNLIKDGEKVSICEINNRLKNVKEEVRFLWEGDSELLELMANSKRFGNLSVCDFINEIVVEQESQFAAVTLFLPDNTIYVSFRGTDNSLVGWKENFNMSFKSHINAQLKAKAYLEKIANENPTSKIKLGGHSKGGNLAVYSATFVSKEIQDRIIKIYNNDGPGFKDDIIETENYKNIVDRVITYIPQDSVFGMLLEHKEKFVIVKSNAKGFMEHDVYSWEVLGKKFIELEEATKQCKFIDKTISTWITNLDLETREQVVDIIFGIIKSTNIVNVREFKESLVSNTNSVIVTYKQIDPENKKMIMATVNELFHIIKNNVVEEYKSKKSI